MADSLQLVGDPAPVATARKLRGSMRGQALVTAASAMADMSASVQAESNARPQLLSEVLLSAAAAVEAQEQGILGGQALSATH